jgi:hypothetical protein
VVLVSDETPRTYRLSVDLTVEVSGDGEVTISGAATGGGDLLDETDPLGRPVAVLAIEVDGLWTDPASGLVESHYVELTGWTVGEAVGQLYGLVVDDYLSDWLAGESPDPLDEGDRP